MVKREEKNGCHGTSRNMGVLAINLYSLVVRAITYLESVCMLQCGKCVQRVWMRVVHEPVVEGSLTSGD